IPVALTVSPFSLLIAGAYGVLVSLAFVLWPLGRVDHVRPALLFRDRVEAARPRPDGWIIGGIAFALSVMGEQFRSMLDVTVVYPDGSPTFWDLVTGRLHNVVVDVREVVVEPWMQGGDNLNDQAYRDRFQRWLTDLWQSKDHRISELIAAHRA
ncbi:MAG: hypothetical protein AAFQ99_11975, partial [Pseudomonadota bacterium]